MLPHSRSPAMESMRAIPRNSVAYISLIELSFSLILIEYTNTMENREPTPNQLSKALPGPTAYLTGHDEKSGKAIIHSKRPVNWASFDEDKLSMSVAYTTSFPPDLNGDADVKQHDEKVASGKLGLVSGGGTVLRYVDFSPEYECMMHRTQSVDYGIVIEGHIESILDSGEVQLMGRGDVMVQRATMVSVSFEKKSSGH